MQFSLFETSGYIYMIMLIINHNFASEFFKEENLLLLHLNISLNYLLNVFNVYCPIKSKKKNDKVCCVNINPKIYVVEKI